jgi:beta-mannosidase
MPPRERHLIDKAWTFKALDYDDDGGDDGSAAIPRPVAQFPTNIHLDLLHHKRIPDPFVGLNENAESVRAVGGTTWVYRTTFPTPASLSAYDDRLGHHPSKAELVFEGLDTIATVELNGERILEANNMFLEYRVPVTDKLRQPSQRDDFDDSRSESGSDSDGFLLVTADGDGATATVRTKDKKVDEHENELVITFDSARKYGKDQQRKNYNHRWICSNGTSERLAVRKAQYHWGWDWGPTLLTCGPWKPIALEVFSARIEDLHAEPLFPDDDGVPYSRQTFEELNTLGLHVQCVVSGAVGEIKFELVGPGGNRDRIEEIVGVGTQQGDRKTTGTVINIPHPKLWYPRRHGPQNMYTLTATLLDYSGNALDSNTRRIGLRRARVVHDIPLDNTPGSTFTFEVNGTPIFCGGSNWIPADSFLPRLTPQKYRNWVDLAVEGNQDMLRVWGGGVYEHDAFYDACDEAGILVWQDFMFACGNYPATPQFLNLVQKEAEQNVRRLRRHPCIVLWAGNNEDYQIAEQSGDLGYDPKDRDDPEKWLQTKFPARYIYEFLLPDVCERLMPRTTYRPGSPWGGKTFNDVSEGDIHQWNVWHGTQRPYQEYGKLVGRFVSEFGMQAFPSLQTTESYLPDATSLVQRNPSSTIIDFHNKAAGQERRLGMYLTENLGYPGKSLEDVTYATQLLQSEAVGCAIRAWRCDGWLGPLERRCGGALVWQLNDCWPCTSWAVCDYALRPKGAFFAMKRELADVVVNVKRYHIAASVFKREPAKTGYIISASNLTLEKKEVLFAVNACEADTGNAVMLHGDDAINLRPLAVPRSFILPPNSSIELCKALYRDNDGAKDVDRHVVCATLMGPYMFSPASREIDEGPGRITRHVSWPDPLKHVPFGEATVDGPFFDKRRQTLALRASKPLKGVFIETTDDGSSVEFGDNFFDLMAGEWFTIKIKGVVTDGTRFKLTYYGAGGVRTLTPEWRYTET